MSEVEVLDRAEISGDKVLVQYSKTESALKDLRAKYSGVVYDLTTTKGDKEARAARLELITLRTSLEKKRKEFKSPALEFGKKIDSEAARITGEIAALELPIDQQIKADEARRAAEKAERDRIESERVAVIQAKIDAIRSFVQKCNGISSERIAKGIDLVFQMNAGEDEFSEFAGKAEVAKAETLEAMQSMLCAQMKHEEEAAQVEAQRLENERIAKEHAAKLEAERIQNALIAEQNRRAAAELAEKQAQLDQQEKAIQEEKNKLAREQEMREAEQARITKIEAEKIEAIRLDEVAKMEAPANVLKEKVHDPESKKITAREFFEMFMADDPHEYPSVGEDGSCVFYGDQIVDYKTVRQSTVWEYKGQFFEVDQSRSNSGYWHDSEQYDPIVTEVFPYTFTEIRYKADQS